MLSRAHVMSGGRLLQARQYREALDRFAGAVRVDPRDGEAYFFTAVALNRLGEHGAVTACIERAQALGFSHPDADFESGWAELALGRPAAALEKLRRRLSQHPTHAQALEFAGRAYLRLGTFESARTCLLEALRLDPGLASSRGEAETAIGYNTNVVAQGQGVTLPADISGQASAFLRFSATAATDRPVGRSDTLTVGYSFVGQDYFRLHSFDLAEHLLYGSYAHPFRRRYTAGLLVSEDVSYVGERHFRDQSTVRPSIAMRHSRHATSELSYAYGRNRYLFPTVETFDRTGESNTVGFTEYLSDDGGSTRGRVGIYRSRNRAVGKEFDFTSTALVLGLERPLIRKVLGEVTYTLWFDRYDHPSALAAIQGNAIVRRDNGRLASLRASWELGRGWRAWATYDRLQSGSNIGFYDYRQEIASTGMTRKF
ncbi:MAG: tetratricopeptide repeat protein [Candidatus Riflebacteria bacterium]|nr:tetratricopeptide repeat protein [Candidatus Riflebacteria bacterium]